MIYKGKLRGEKFLANEFLFIFCVYLQFSTSFTIFAVATFSESRIYDYNF